MSNENSNNQPAPRPRRVWFWLIIAAVAVVSGGIGAVTSGIHHRHHALMRSPIMLLGAPGDPANSDERAAWVARQFARHVSATAEQKTKIDAIVSSAIKDMEPLHAKMRDARNKVIEVLRQPTVTRDDVEKLRAEHLAIGDALSKRLAQAAGDLTEVLTFEQRKELADDLTFFAKLRERKNK